MVTLLDTLVRFVPLNVFRVLDQQEIIFILFLLKDTLIIILFTGVSSISINIVLFCTSPAFVLFFLTAFHNCNFGDFGNAFLS